MDRQNKGVLIILHHKRMHILLFTTQNNKAHSQSHMLVSLCCTKRTFEIIKWTRALTLHEIKKISFLSPMNHNRIVYNHKNYLTDFLMIWKCKETDIMILKFILLLYVSVRLWSWYLKMQLFLHKVWEHNGCQPRSLTVLVLPNKNLNLTQKREIKQ